MHFHRRLKINHRSLIIDSSIVDIKKATEFYLYTKVIEHDRCSDSKLFILKSQITNIFCHKSAVGCYVS